MTESPRPPATGPTIGRRWSEAMDDALYGLAGFYRREAPAAHFRTSISSAGCRAVLAEALGSVLGRLDATLGHPRRLDLVDVGTGDGSLLAAIWDSSAVRSDPSLADRLWTHAVELRDRPAELDPRVRWATEIPPIRAGLVLANEWLDNVPFDLAVTGPTGATHLLAVDPSGEQSAGPAPGPADRAWLDQWWPNGSVREIGRARDAAWATVIGAMEDGLALAIDYGHVRTSRPPGATLTGFRHGREVPPIPDGSCDLTAHVALDSVAAAGLAAGAGSSLLTDQRSALLGLGVSARRPTYDADPSGYAVGLQRASDAAELLDPAGLGAFHWLVQGVGAIGDLGVVHQLLTAPTRPPAGPAT